MALTRAYPFLLLGLLFYIFCCYPLVAQTQCLIRVEGTNYHSTPCNLRDETDSSVLFGHRGENGSGYWVRIQTDQDGSSSAYWTGVEQTDDAQVSLGRVFRDGDCWSNSDVELCSDLPADTPRYFVDRTAGIQGAVMSHVNGRDYVLLRAPLDEHAWLLEIEAQSDLDGDGYAEALVSVSEGFNPYWQQLLILSYKGNGFFTFLEYIDETEIRVLEPIPGDPFSHMFAFGWGGFDIIPRRDGSTIRVYDSPVGIRNTSSRRSVRDYYVTSQSVTFEGDKEEIGTLSTLTSISVEQFADNPEGIQSIEMDIDLDGSADMISCSYLQRRGLLQCSVDLSSLAETSEVQCFEIGVLPRVVGSPKGHQIGCGHEVIDFQAIR